MTITINRAMLAPAAALVVWTLIVLLWMARSRFGALGERGLGPADAPPGLRGCDLEPRLPPQVMWKSHNYTHLLEQPTLFYAVCVMLALLGSGLADVVLAWAYVALRVVHSWWQCTVNTIPIRIRLFKYSSLALLALAARALYLALA